AHVPERIAPGKAIEELTGFPRVVGGVGPKSTGKAVELYSIVNSKLMPADATTAEFVKLIENTFRDLNIAYANFLALLAERLGIDVYEAIKLANTHPRVNIHMPGAGVGGPCLTKDPYLLIEKHRDVYGAELIQLSRRINEYMPSHVVSMVLRSLSVNGIDPSKAKVAVLGVTYKGDVDDVRESPSKHIVGKLLEKVSEVVVYDPYSSEAFGGKRASTLEEAVSKADVVVIATDHKEFKGIDLPKLKELVNNPIIVDGRRVVDPYKAFSHGFKYYGVGFGKVVKL
ncbi:MAG: nucleotide sugar dehydrogenase, partial [Candidatus Methanomethylicota archaeon]